MTSTVTVFKPRGELYSFWRNLENLPKIMDHLQSVTELDGKRSHWVSRGPAGKTLEWDAEIINEIPNELIGWRSLEGADVDNAGSVSFSDAPGGRGTVIRVELRYDPPGGKAGALIAKLFRESPSIQIPQELRRFKQLMESGEVATTDGQSSGRS